MKYVLMVEFAIISAAQRAEIGNLASALAAQNEELERLKEDLAEMSRVPVHPQYFHLPGQLTENRDLQYFIPSLEIFQSRFTFTIQFM